MVPFSPFYPKAQAPLPAQYDARKAGTEELSEAPMTTHLRLSLLIQASVSLLPMYVRAFTDYPLTSTIP